MTFVEVNSCVWFLYESRKAVHIIREVSQKKDLRLRKNRTITSKYYSSIKITIVRGNSLFDNCEKKFPRLLRVNRKVCNAKLVATISLECRVHVTEKVRNHFLVSWVKIDISSIFCFVRNATPSFSLKWFANLRYYVKFQ